MDPVNISVGIDVAKDWLDVAEWPDNAAWREPNDEPGIASMRDPIYPRDAGAITIWSGNQFQGGGNPGNQLQDGSAVVYRVWGSGDAWAEQPLLYASTSGNNIYYSATLPASAKPNGVVLTPLVEGTMSA